MERTPLKMRIQDRGATRVQFRTQGIDALVEAVKKAGLNVVSHGGVAVPIPPDFRGALVADPSNFFFLFEPWTGARSLPPSTAVTPPGGPGRGRAGADTPAAPLQGSVARTAVHRRAHGREPALRAQRRHQPQDRGEAVRTGRQGHPRRASRGPLRLWTGMATSPVAVTLRDKRNYVDLTGLARLNWIVRTNAIHTLYPVVKLADGTLAAGTRASHRRRVPPRRDRVRRHEVVQAGSGQVGGAGRSEAPNLARVDEVGLVTLAPAGGHGIAGSANLSDVELYAKAVPRSAAAVARRPPLVLGATPSLAACQRARKYPRSPTRIEPRSRRCRPPTVAPCSAATAEQYADLFATPGGYFGSGARGEVRERKALIEMVVGYDRCKPADAAATE